MSLCPSCRHTAEGCSYPGEARPGCLRDKRKPDEFNESAGATNTEYARAKIKLRAMFPTPRSSRSIQSGLIVGTPQLLLATLA